MKRWMQIKKGKMWGERGWLPDARYLLFHYHVWQNVMMLCYEEAVNDGFPYLKCEGHGCTCETAWGITSAAILQILRTSWATWTSDTKNASVLIILNISQKPSTYQLLRAFIFNGSSGATAQHESTSSFQTDLRSHVLAVNAWPLELYGYPCAPWCRPSVLPSAGARNPDVFDRKHVTASSLV